MISESLVFDRIVDDLYAGALEPAAGERGLKSIARLIGGQGPFLLAFNPIMTAVLRDQIYDHDPAVFRDFREQWSAKNIRLDLGLSAREAELASLLAAGRTLELAAVQLGISFETARTHLRSIFGKTGLHTQADLIRRILSGPAVTRHTTSAGLPRTGDSPPTPTSP